MGRTDESMGERTDREGHAEVTGSLCTGAMRSSWRDTEGEAVQERGWII